jgi:hypothetical protein
MKVSAKSIRTAAVAALAIALLIGARPANAQVTRLAENMGYVGGPGFLTYNTASDGGLGGSPFYANRITVPANANTLFIDLTGVVALDSVSNRALFTCTIDSSLLCVPQALYDANSEPKGWIALSTLSYNAQPGTIIPYFNTIHMTWCIPPGRYTQGGTQHTVGLRLADDPFNSMYDNGVLLQQAKVTIDAVQVSDTTNACTGKGFLSIPIG